MTRIDLLKIASLLLLPLCFKAQKTESIHFAKNADDLVFFQKGDKKDTLAVRSEFYLIVPSALKSGISIQTDNASLSAINDSTAVLDHRPGLSYESYYVHHRGASKKPEWAFRVSINGTTGHAMDEVVIRFMDRGKQEVLMENRYTIRR